MNILPSSDSCLSNRWKEAKTVIPGFYVDIDNLIPGSDNSRQCTPGGVKEMMHQIQTTGFDNGCRFQAYPTQGQCVLISLSFAMIS